MTEQYSRQSGMGDWFEMVAFVGASLYRKWLGVDGNSVDYMQWVVKCGGGKSSLKMPVASYSKASSTIQKPAYKCNKELFYAALSNFQMFFNVHVVQYTCLVPLLCKELIVISFNCKIGTQFLKVIQSIRIFI